MANPLSPVKVDGSADFSGGVNSICVPTVQGPNTPNGLPRNMLAWLVNAGVRDGGITQRATWKNNGKVFDSTGLFQGGFMYQPDSANPYPIVSISGNIFKVDPDTGAATNLSTAFNLFMPSAETQSYFVQGENYLVIQCGDFGKGGPVIPGVTDALGNTLPLFWDGTTLRRSIGIVTNTAPDIKPNINEIPAATVMDYYQGHIWYGQARAFAAGDTVGGPSGNKVNHFRDSIISVTENPLCFGGDGFTLPTNAGNIRALFHTAAIDQTLGQGQLLISTRKDIYSLTVPQTRADWIAAGNSVSGASSAYPLLTVSQINHGTVNDRSIVQANGDIFYQSLEPAIRTYFTARRDFGMWANRPISANEQRILQFNDRALLHFASGILFDNRVLQTALPTQAPQGVYHKAIIPLDLTPYSTLQAQLPPAWQGHWEGLRIMQLFVADFGGLDRAFAIVLSEIDSSLELWEFSTGERFENGDGRVTWRIEWPAFTWPAVSPSNEFSLKHLVGGEIWADKVWGEVEFRLSYRVDSDPCERPWHVWRRCTARNSCEDVNNPVCYPLVPGRESYAAVMALPQPPTTCATAMGRPANIGMQIQPILTIKGFCRIRGVLLGGVTVEREQYSMMVC